MRLNPTARRGRSARILIAALTLSAATVVPVALAAPAHAAPPTSWYLNLTGQSQEQTNWCWAATGNSIAAYFNYSYTQNQFCNMAFNRQIDSTCSNDQATLGNDQTAFRQIGISAGTYITGMISMDTVINQIAADQPIMTRIVWASGGGHMMDIIGYDSSNSTIQYYDPWPSDSRLNTSTLSWYQSNSQFTWTHTLYGIGG